MKKSFYIVVVILSSFVLCAENINLVANGKLEAEQVDLPSFWVARPVNQITLVRGGGPRGLNCVILRNPMDSKDKFSGFRQEGIKLVPGEKYRLTGYVKTKNLTNKRVEFVVHNHGWTESTGIMKFPVNSKWTKYEHTFTAFNSDNLSYYGVIFLLGKGQGELAVADLHLEPLTKKAKNESASVMGANNPKLVPITPLLYQIPLNSPFLYFSFFPGNAGNDNKYVCKFTSHNFTQTMTMGKNMLKLDLSPLPAGEHLLKAEISKADKKVIFKTEYPIKLVKIEKFKRQGRKLNNLVTELVNKKVNNNETVKFVNFRDGWIYISAPQGTEVVVDKKDKLQSHEGVRLLSQGNHSIKINGNFKNGRILINAIPEILIDSVARDSYVKENGKYDWKFVEKYMLPEVTTITRGWGDDVRKKAKTRGLLWLSNFLTRTSTHKEPTIDTMAERLEKTPGMTLKKYDGFTVDEIYGASPRKMAVYTGALRKIPLSTSKLIYTYLIGGSLDIPTSVDFLSACANASQGKGKILFEAYCMPQKNKKDAEAYLDNFLNQNIANYRRMYPGIIKSFSVVLGDYNQIPLISLEHYPDVDMKYYLDMQVHMIVNQPAFDGLGSVGYWGTYYADEEMIRWASRLMRHYVLEGNKDMLSKRYGFTYKLKYLKNPGFENGLTDWTVSGNATPGSHEGFCKINMALWFYKGDDRFCLMTREQAKPTEISQTAQGLNPEKLYVIQFVTADYNDVKDKKFKPRSYGINVKLPGAEIIKEKSFVHIPERNFLKNKFGEYGAINLNRVVFKPGKITQKIIFSNEKAKPGEKLILSFVQLKPYYNE